MRSPGGGPPEGSEADDHFSRLVEQEVDKRLFQEKIMRAESGEFKGIQNSQLPNLLLSSKVSALS